MPENDKRHRGYRELMYRDPTRRSYRAEATRVYVAIGERHIRRMLAGALREEGYEVIEGGERLFDSGDEDAVDLIVVDARAAKWLAEIRQTDWSIPVILITAFASQEVKREAAELDVDFVLHEPFGVVEFVDAVRDLVPATWD